MTRACSIQQHPERPAIDASIRNGVSNRRTASTYGMDEASVRRHAKHIDICPPPIAAEQEQSPQVITKRRRQSPHGIAVPRHESPHMIPIAADHNESPQAIDARCDRIDANLSELTGYWRVLDSVLLPTLRQVLVAVQSKPVLPDAGVTMRIEARELDTEGLPPREAMRIVLREVMRIYRQVPRKEQPAMGRFIGEQLQGIAGEEEW